MNLIVYNNESTRIVGYIVDTLILVTMQTFPSHKNVFYVPKP